jgi:hypothetical protein
VDPSADDDEAIKRASASGCTDVVSLLLADKRVCFGKEQKREFTLI